MKLISFPQICLFIFLTILSVPVFACDICGCGVGSNYIGILPEFSKTVLGLRYRYNSLRTHISGGTVTYLTTDEMYRTTELWSGFHISKKIRIIATIPYHFNERVNQGKTLSKNGLGDLSLNGFYQLLNQRKTVWNHTLLVQSLWLGGGIKLPTGKYDPVDKAPLADNTNLFQLGTGSIDFSAHLMYDIRLQDAGLNTILSYKMNTANNHQYRYGNKLAATIQGYYKFRLLKTVTIAPNAGIQYETAQKDVDGKYSVDVSGGNVLNGTLGAEISIQKISVGFNWQSPVSQNLAGGFVKANSRMMAHISFIM